MSRSANNAAPGDIVDQAIAWQLHFDATRAAAAEHDGFQKWLNADERHASAWNRLRAIDKKFSGLGASAGRALRKRAPVRNWRSHIVASVLLGLVLICAGMVTDRVMPVAGLVADYSTRTGEWRRVVLPDGTIMFLNARTVVDLAFDARTRTLKLRQGEVAIETAHDDQRPFIVQTPHTQIRALGTYFTVGTEGVRTEVTVIRSAVAIRVGVSERIFEAGQRAVIDQDGQLVWSGNAPEQSDAWTYGMLTADHVPLAEFVRKLSAYRPGVVTVDPLIAQLPVSGAFAMADTDLALAAMAQVVPVRIEQVAPGWARVVPKK